MSFIRLGTGITSHSNMMCNNCCRLFFSYVSVLKDGKKCPFCDSKNTTVIKDEDE